MAGGAQRVGKGGGMLAISEAAASAPRSTKPRCSLLPLMVSLVVVLALLLVNARAASDAEALLAIKAAMVDEFNSLESWTENATTTPCAGWLGVSCDADGRVSGLNISGLNLTGTLSPAIGQLTALTDLSLEQNNFTGTLPAELAALTGLKFLNASHNNFSYAFPAGFAALTKLECLDTYNNNFSGPLPEELAQLPRLAHLHLGGSYFESTIPASYGNITSLKYLAVSGNSLTGFVPPELGNLTGLTELYLGYFNVFQGGIPPELGKLKRLTILDIGGSGLSGPIPPELGGLENLDTLFLQFNKLSGPVPPELGNLTKLRSLDLSLNHLSGEVPDALRKLDKLELLSLFSNDKFTGRIPDFIAELPNLQVLFLWDNAFSGSIPEALGANGNLTAIDLSRNALTGVIPPHLCDGPLDRLILQTNELSGPIPDSIGDCASLTYLRLGHNQLNGTLPDNLLNLPLLEFVELLDNRLEGPVPHAFVLAANVSRLDLSENQFTGALPPSISNLRRVQVLALQGNAFSGAIPAEVGDLAALNTLDLSRNAFTGDIPREISECAQLSFLDLSSNRLAGEIPGELSKLPVLTSLNLSRNELDGPIPTGLQDLQTLTIVDFSYNNLSGQVPVQGPFEFFNYSSYEGNPGLCGPSTIIPDSACQPKAVEVPPVSPPPRRQGGGKDAPIAWIVGGLFVAALLVLLAGFCCFFGKYRWFILSVLNRNKSVRPWKLTAFQRLGFTANHVLECLSEDNIIGRGGAGTVYKGEMPDGQIIAVKRLPAKATCKGSSHDHGFSAEIQTLGKIRHKNIVRLLGCCSNHETNLLVYEYMPNGSLGELLHGKKHGLLDWDTRHSIAVQAAQGLCYLHHDCSPLIVHRDVKSNNILLDSNLEAHVADFGLAKLLQTSGMSQSMSSIAGSYGYIAPEYAYTLKVNEKSDIYSFGVVLMELITGKRPIEQEFGEGVDIVQWVRGKIQSKDMGAELLDVRLGRQNLPLQEVMLVLRVALLCTGDLPIDRPTMREVVQMLSDVKASSKAAKDNNLSAGPGSKQGKARKV